MKNIWCYIQNRRDFLPWFTKPGTAHLGDMTCCHFPFVNAQEPPISLRGLWTSYSWLWMFSFLLFEAWLLFTLQVSVKYHLLKEVFFFTALLQSHPSLLHHHAISFHSTPSISFIHFQNSVMIHLTYLLLIVHPSLQTKSSLIAKDIVYLVSLCRPRA